MPLRVKQLGVKIGIRIMRGLIALKKGLTVFLFCVAYPFRAVLRILWALGGRWLALTLLRLFRARHRAPSPLTRPLPLLFTLLLVIAIGYQLMTTRERSTVVPKADDVIEAAATTPPIIQETAPQAIGVPSILPGEELVPLPTIAGGNAILSPVIATTRLENRLREAPETYIVEEGDTLSQIAERFGISVATILWENKLTLRSILRPGMSLTILPVSGLSHVVQRGETLVSIARRYKVEEAVIRDFNELETSVRIAVGQKLIVPEGEPPAPTPRPLARTPVVRIPRIPPPSALVPGSRLAVPVVYKRISQWFTWRHSGIDMASPYGTPIHAAQEGVVVQAGWGSGYGLYVLIDHGQGLMTRYAHNAKNYVSRGDRVKRGETIAVVGSTGRSTGPHVHFETIVNGRFVNPLRYIKL